MQARSEVGRPPPAVATVYSSTYIRRRVRGGTWSRNARSPTCWRSRCSRRSSQRPMHRYEMASTCAARGKDQDMDVKWGSLYTVVQNMESTAWSRPPASPGRAPAPSAPSTASPTPVGPRCATGRGSCSPSREPERPRFAAGLSVMAGLPPDEAAGLLSDRLDALGERIAGQRRRAGRDTAGRSRGCSSSRTSTAGHARGRGDWVRALLAELDAGTFPDLEQWRAWHETGELTAGDGGARGRERCRTPAERPRQRDPARRRCGNTPAGTLPRTAARTGEPGAEAATTG